MKKKVCWAFTNQQDIDSSEIFSFYWTEWTTSRKRTFPSTGSCYIWNKTSSDTWCSTSFSPLIPAASTRNSLPSRCRVFKGFEPTEFLDSETSQALKSVQLKCVACRKRKSESVTQIRAEVPRGRLAFGSSPFSNTRIDYFGPFYVSVERSMEKRCGFLFTCFTTSVVHFEVVPSWDTSSCVMEIERFGARRGVPSVIGSENGTNFIATEEEVLNNVQETLTDSVVKKSIKWKFNPPSKPHHGCKWERPARCFRHTLYAILGNRRLTD